MILNFWGRPYELYPNPGGADGSRTRDLLNAIQVCSQLHHGPTIKVAIYLIPLSPHVKDHPPGFHRIFGDPPELYRISFPSKNRPLPLHATHDSNHRPIESLNFHRSIEDPANSQRGREILTLTRLTMQSVLSQCVGCG